jgi:hypothetical protein
MFKIVFKIMKKYFSFIFKMDLYTNEDFEINFQKEETSFYQRCKSDPIFFFENCVSSDIVINEYVKRFVDSFINKKSLVVYNNRSIGVTTGYLILTLWLLTFYPSYNITIILPTNIHVHNFRNRLLNLFESVNIFKQKYTFFKENNIIEISDNLSKCKLITNLKRNYDAQPVNTVFIDNAEMIPDAEEMFRSFFINELLSYCKDSEMEIPYSPCGLVVSSSFSGYTDKKSFEFIRNLFDNYKLYGFEESLKLTVN